MIASQMVIRPTEMVKCLIHLWRYIKGTSGLSMTSFSPNSNSAFGKLRLNVYVDASFSSGGIPRTTVPFREARGNWHFQNE